MENLIPLFLLMMAPVAYYAWKEYNKPGSVQPVNSFGGIDYGRQGRKCLSCGFQGPMKTWLGNYGVPQLIVLIGLLFWLIPGLIFVAVYWGKHKCPSCGAVGKNHPISDAQSIQQKGTPSIEDTKFCPFCAETIKRAAVVCRYCNRDIPAA